MFPSCSSIPPIFLLLLFCRPVGHSLPSNIYHHSTSYELHATYLIQQNATEVVTHITEDLLQNFIVKVKRLTSLSPVWDSVGTSSHAQVGIWASTAVRSLITRSRVGNIPSHHVILCLCIPFHSILSITPSLIIPYDTTFIILYCIIPHHLASHHISYCTTWYA